MSVLICDNITKIYKDYNSIKNFSFNFLDNQIYAIIRTQQFRKRKRFYN